MAEKVPQLDSNLEPQQPTIGFIHQPTLGSAPPPYSYCAPTTGINLEGPYAYLMESSWNFLNQQSAQTDGDWIFYKTLKGFQIYQKRSAKYVAPGIKMSGVFRHHPGRSLTNSNDCMQTVLYYLWGVECMKDDKNVIESKLLECVSENCISYTYTEKFPWPLSNREYVTSAQKWYDSNTGKTYIWGTPIDSVSVPKKSKPVRAIEEFLLILQASPTDALDVCLTAVIFYDVGGNLSQSVGETDVDAIAKSIIDIQLALNK